MLRQLFRIALIGSVACALVAQGGTKKDDFGEATTHKTKKITRKRPATRIKRMTLTGTIVMIEKEKGGKIRPAYQLQQESGLTIDLPKAAGIRPERYVGQQVTVTGQGKETGAEDGDALRNVVLKRITSIRPVKSVAKLKAKARVQGVEVPSAEDGDM